MNVDDRKNRNIEILKYLVEHGANVNCSDSKGNTPMNYAVRGPAYLTTMDKKLYMFNC